MVRSLKFDCKKVRDLGDPGSIVLVRIVCAIRYRRKVHDALHNHGRTLSETLRFGIVQAHRDNFWRRETALVCLTGSVQKDSSRS